MMKRGLHKVFCLFCKNPDNLIECYDYHNAPNLCKNISKHICRKCKNTIRSQIQTTENLHQYNCNHIKTISSQLIPSNLRRNHGYYCNSLGRHLWCCRLCMSEIHKEVNLRERHEQKHRNIEKQKRETLTEKCASIIVRHPQLLLTATQCPLDEHIWEIIYNAVPTKISDAYKNDLIKPTKYKWMYKTITDVFSL